MALLSAPIVGAQASSLWAHTVLPCWRTSVPSVGTQECSSLGHERVRRRNIKRILLAHCRLTSVFTVGAQERSLLVHKHHCQRAQACSPSAHESVPSWRTWAFPVGAQECSLLAHKRTHHRRAYPPAAHKRISLFAHRCLSSAHQNVFCWRTSVFIVGTHSCSVLTGGAMLAHTRVRRRRTRVFLVGRRSAFTVVGLICEVHHCVTKIWRGSAPALACASEATIACFTP